MFQDGICILCRDVKMNLYVGMCKKAMLYSGTIGSGVGYKESQGLNRSWNLTRETWVF